MATQLRVPPAQDHRFLGQPVGLATLFTTELWERFSYYGMRAILVLYLVAPTEDGGLGMSTAQAVSIYGVYSAMVWLLAVPGGWLSDRAWGWRKARRSGAPRPPGIERRKQRDRYRRWPLRARRPDILGNLARARLCRYRHRNAQTQYLRHGRRPLRRRS